MEADDILSDSDLFVYAKAKMKRLHHIKSTKVVVKQYGNLKHEKLNKKLRNNAPDELEDNHIYKNATIGTIRGISIKEK